MNSTKLIRPIAAFVMCTLMLIFASFKLQDRQYRLIKSIAASNSMMTSDNLGHVYLVRDDHSVEKYNKNGELLCANNFKILGPLHSLDAGNPMELYAFYREQNILGILDNQLGLRARIDLNESGNNAISCLARSYDNAIWLFDQQKLQLKKYSKNLDLLYQSGNIRSITGIAPNPSMLYDDGQNIFLVDSVNGVMIFDLYANYVSTLHVKARHIQSDQQKYLLSGVGSPEWMNEMDLFPKPFDTPFNLNNAHVRSEKDRLYVYRNDTLSIIGF